MSTLTPTLNLIKPAIQDTFDVSTVNANMDRVDKVAESLNSISGIKAAVNPHFDPWAVLTGIPASGLTHTLRYRKIGSLVIGTITASGNYSDSDFKIPLPYQPVSLPNIASVSNIGTVTLVAGNGQSVNGALVLVYTSGSQYMTVSMSALYNATYNNRQAWLYYSSGDLQDPGTTSTWYKFPTGIKITGTFHYETAE